MVITAIIPQKRHPEKVNIFLDGKYAFSMNLELLVKHGLKTDQYLTQDEISHLIRQEDLLIWYNRILNLLSRRPRSKKEILIFLKNKQVGQTTIETVLAKLEQKNLINDEEFARWFVKQRQEFRPKGKLALKMELINKGISKEIIETVLNSMIDTTSELALVNKLIDKKRQVWQKLNRAQVQKKITGFLLRRGFSWEVIKQVMASF